MFRLMVMRSSSWMRHTSRGVVSYSLYPPYIYPTGCRQEQFFSTTTRDVRLAGRRRFYKDVGVAVCPPPWQHQQQQQFVGTVVIPGGAGVDGSDSANGISLLDPHTAATTTPTEMYEMLIPDQKDVSSSTLSSSWYTVTLDSRPLATPLGTPLSLPSLPLALFVATEWSNQTKYLQPTQMPFTTLCCTALDQMTIPAVRQGTIDKLLRYLQTDTTCYWADPIEDRILHRKQKNAWDGLHTWISKGTGGLSSYSFIQEGNTDISSTLETTTPPLPPDIQIATTTGLIGLITRHSSSQQQQGLPHSPQALQRAKVFLESLDAWRLTAMQAVTMEAKSFIIGMALISGTIHTSSSSSNNTIPFIDDIFKAVTAARVEEECQIESWGLVEGQHDYDRLNTSIQLHSAILLSHCVNTKLFSIS